MRGSFLQSPNLYWRSATYWCNGLGVAPEDTSIKLFPNRRPRGRIEIFNWPAGAALKLEAFRLLITRARETRACSLQSIPQKWYPVCATQIGQLKGFDQGAAPLPNSMYMCVCWCKFLHVCLLFCKEFWATELSRDKSVLEIPYPS
jgi:hypothetical protein